MKTLLTSVCIILMQLSYSQTSISITNNSFNGGFISFSPSVFQDLAPNSELLNQANNPGDYSTVSKGLGFSYGNTTIFAIELPAKKEFISGLSNGVWRIGLQIGSKQDFSYFIENKKYVEGVDTIRYTSNKPQEILDSINSKTYNVNHNTKTIGVDLAYILSTNVEKRFSLKFGVGAALQLGINSNTTVSLYERHELYAQSDYNTPYDYANNDNGIKQSQHEDEHFKNKTGYGMQLYVPILLDFRIANKGFFKKVHYLIGTNIITQVYNVPEIDWNSDQFIAFSTGLRFNLN
jgi:hypothetical protein